MKDKENGWYEIEVASTTFRTYEVKAESATIACDIALSEVDADWTISKAWKENADVISCDSFTYDEHGNKVVIKSY